MLQLGFTSCPSTVSQKSCGRWADELGPKLKSIMTQRKQGY